MAVAGPPAQAQPGLPAQVQICQPSGAPLVGFAEATSRTAQTPPCVMMEGLLIGGLFVEDALARYRRETIANDPSSSGAVLGYYGAQTFSGPVRVRIVGRLGDCATVDRQTMATPITADQALRGYCAQFRGRIIHAASVEPLGAATITRAVAGGSGDLGNLAPIAPGDVRTRFSRAGSRLVDAIRTADRAALAAMHGGGPGGRRSPADVDRVVRLLLDDPQSPFAMLRTATEVSTQIFGWKPPLWADQNWQAAAMRSGDLDAIVCLSTRPDAARLWPIDSRDADNRPGRPYACTRIHIGGTGADSPARFDTDQAVTGAEEPPV